MQTHHTKGIVLKTIKYGDTSIIANIYTELFGIQSYIIKGVRTASKKNANKANYFQPTAILDLEVYHNELKQLQFIKEYSWSYLYQVVLFDVVKHAAALYMIELLQHSLKQPEANPELFYLIENSLTQLDKGNDTLTANLPLFFVLHLATELGFQIQGSYQKATPILDLKEGMFVDALPNHQFWIDGLLAETSSQIMHIHFYNDLENIALNRTIRRQLLAAYQLYFQLHIADFGTLKSLQVLQEVL